MSELNAGQIIDEATRLAGKSDDDAMDLVPMHRWWWRYSQNLDSMLRHMLLDHDQMHAVPAPGQEELSCMGCKWFDDYPCDNSNPCLSCIRRKLPRDNYLPSAPAPEKGEAKHNAGPCDASPFSSDGNQAPAQPAPSEEEPGLDEHEAALALTYKIETLINETMACGGGISDSEWRAIVYEELHQFIAGNRSALRSRLSEAPLPLLCDVEEALVDLGACDNPYCTDCPRVLPRVREAIREHAAGTEPAGRIR